jgi:hypothetical protein
MSLLAIVGVIAILSSGMMAGILFGDLRLLGLL